MPAARLGVMPPDAGLRTLGLVHADPELFAGLDDGERARASREAVARRLELEPGPWSGLVAAEADPRRDLGLLVTAGLLLRSVRLDGLPRSELVGPGDVIRPWADAGVSSVACQVSWDVLEPAQLALLDPVLVRVLCRWPGVVDALMRRAAVRADELGVQLAIVHRRRVADRLVALFSRIGRRWGHRDGDDLVIPFALTHETLAQLIGAHRPTVTMALVRLSAQGCVRRRPDQSWLLVGGPAAEIGGG